MEDQTRQAHRNQHKTKRRRYANETGEKGHHQVATGEGRKDLETDGSTGAQ
jgi:hypothetical protein